VKEISLGASSHQTVVMTPEMGTQHAGPSVLATPAMIAAMELACAEAARPCLEGAEQTVGTMVHVWHRAAAKIGETLEVDAKLIEQDRRKLLFEVKASCAGKVIGEGTHERFVVDPSRFKG
jgi:fluoroacetyl-CoA thioesterase